MVTEIKTGRKVLLKNKFSPLISIDEWKKNKILGTRNQSSELTRKLLFIIIIVFFFTFRIKKCPNHVERMTSLCQESDTNDN